MTTHSDDPNAGGHRRWTRRQLMGTVAGAIAATASRGALASDAPDLAQAKREGDLVIWHADQENNKVEFLKAFTDKTGIKAISQRVLPGVALPKLMAEIRAGGSDVDIYNSSDEGVSDELRKQGHLLRYQSAELAAYDSVYKSNPEGFWTAYFINLNPMMYVSRFVPPDEAPKSWADLLDPRWAGQIGFQNSSAGSQYVWWYNLRPVMPPDFWEKLRAQKPRGYASSTQIVTDLFSGNLKIGGKVSAYQYVQALRKGQDLKVVFPTEGTPTSSQVTSIIATTKRPNAAKVYTDFLLSKEGQQLWNQIQGSHSARSDVTIPDVPPLKDIKILIARDFPDFASRQRHAEFVSTWNKVLGF